MRGKAEPELVPAADQVGAAHLRRALENGHSQEQTLGSTPENSANSLAQQAGSTPENAKLLAKYVGYLECSPLTRQSPHLLRKTANASW
jgi:hypothetical protein